MKFYTGNFYYNVNKIQIWMSDKITTSCENIHTMLVFSQFIAKHKKYGRTRNNNRYSYGHKHMPPHRCNVFWYDMRIHWHSLRVVSCSLCCYKFSSSRHLHAELTKIQTSNHIIYCFMGWSVWGSNPSECKILRTHPDQTWCPSSSCTMGTAFPSL